MEKGIYFVSYERGNSCILSGDLGISKVIITCKWFVKFFLNAVGSNWSFWVKILQNAKSANFEKYQN